MAVLIIFPVILQTVINLRMLFIGGQGATDQEKYDYISVQYLTLTAINYCFRNQD